MWSIIVPLVKAKGGNMQHISNYRAIALSNASSTIFELVFKPYLFVCKARRTTEEFQSFKIDGLSLPLVRQFTYQSVFTMMMIYST
jgi:hypothetical protein